ncbi:MAG TPA: AtpZ/AtpI family protein [Stellaceae bacterium]
MDERDTPDALRDLGRRLDKARREAQATDGQARSGGDSAAGQNALAMAFRIGLELIVAVFVGAALGWAFDNWLGTGPWGLIAFVFLGFAAGVTNVFRLALGMEKAVGYGTRKPAPPPQGNWSDEDED